MTWIATSWPRLSSGRIARANAEQIAVKPRSRLTLVAVAFEASLGLVGCVFAWWFGVGLADRLRFSPDVAWRSGLGLAPMLALLAVAMWSQWPPLVRLRHQVQSFVHELFGGASAWELAAVSLAAGVGEELLFRGALQPLAERGLGPMWGLLAVSVLFGTVHAASAMYFLLTTAVGLYLGWLAQRYDDLVAPIVIHAAYDLAALAMLLRSSGQPRPEDELASADDA
jgi:membrane protease YdiL (CAAX protease family)